MDFFETADNEKFGLGLTGFGIFFSLLGIIFNKGLAVMGNTLLICGVPLTIGLNSTMQLLMKPSNLKGTILFAIGFFLVVIMGWPFWGMMMEGYGFFLLSSGFWPTIAVFLLKILAFDWFLLQQFFRSVENIQRRSISADFWVENSRTEDSTHDDKIDVNENRYNNSENEFDQKADEDAESYRYMGEILSSMDAGNTLPVPVIEPGSGKQTDKASRRSLFSKWFKFWGRSKPRKLPLVELVESSGANEFATQRLDISNTEARGNANLLELRSAIIQNSAIAQDALRDLEQMQAMRDLFFNSRGMVSEAVLEEIAVCEANVAIKFQKIVENSIQLNLHV